MSDRCIRNNGYVVCFTDGACSLNGQHGAQAGIGVYFGDDHPWNISGRLHPRFRQTNNTAEIQAAVEAIYKAKRKGENHLEIRSDSDFMIKGITEWIYTWDQNGWRNSSGERVINKEDFMDLKDAMKSIHHVIFVHVPAHQGTWGNEQADKLARDGARHGDWHG